MNTKTLLRFLRIIFESTTSRLWDFGFSVGYSVIRATPGHISLLIALLKDILLLSVESAWISHAAKDCQCKDVPSRSCSEMWQQRASWIRTRFANESEMRWQPWRWDIWSPFPPCLLQCRLASLCITKDSLQLQGQRWTSYQPPFLSWCHIFVQGTLCWKAEGRTDTVLSGIYFGVELLSSTAAGTVQWVRKQ